MSLQPQAGAIRAVEDKAVENETIKAIEDEATSIYVTSHVCF